MMRERHSTNKNRKSRQFTKDNDAGGDKIYLRDVGCKTGRHMRPVIVYNNTKAGRQMETR